MAVVIREEPERGIAVLTLNRPDALNTLNSDLVEALHAELASLTLDRDIRAVVVTGAGRAFCAGVDLKEGANAETPTAGELYAQQVRLTGLALAIHRLRQPVIAAVNGDAVGGGFGLAVAADLRVAGTQARFGSGFIRLGLSSCDIAVSYFLPRLVGTGRAAELMLTGDLLDARGAERLGLVNRVADGDVVEAAVALAGRIVRHSEYGVRMTKEVLWANVDAPSISHAVELEYRTQILGVLGGDVLAAVDAFVHGRTPTWSKF